MYILTLDTKETEGAYSVQNEEGDSVLYLFQEEDDAERYAMMLEEEGYPELEVVEVDDSLLIKTCEIQGYQYTIITPNDIVIPPENLNYDRI